MNITKILLLLIILLCIYNNINNREYYESFNNIFNTYIINLEHRTDRRKNIQKQLDEHHIHGLFYKAINGKNLNIDKLIQSEESIIGDRKMRAGEYGCYFSHMNVYEEFIKSNKKYLLVLEDDVQLINDFTIHVITAISELEKNNIYFDMLFLATNCKTDCNGISISNNVFKPTKLGNGMQSYIVTILGAQKMLNIKYPITYPIDVLIDIDYNSDKPIMQIYKTKKSLTHILNIYDSDTIKIL